MSSDAPRVLVLHVAKSSLEPAYGRLLAALGDTPSELFDPSRPLREQMHGKAVVVDIGGWGQAAHIEAARDEGVALWQVLGYGLDHLDLDAALASGMMLARTPGPTTAVPLAEHAMFLLLSVVKQANASRAAMAAGQFYDAQNGELDGTTMVVVGLGASGRELARRAHGFGMRVIGVDVQPMADEAMTRYGVASCVLPADLPRVLGEADVVSLHLPLTEETRHGFGREAFAAMKPGAILINVARGALVDESAMVDALSSGHLAGVGLDVFEVEPLPADHPLWAFPSAVLTPHWAAATMPTMDRRAAVVAANVRRVLDGQLPEFRVDVA